MYSTLAEVRNALTPGGDRTDKTTAAGLDDPTLTASIVEADAVIDSYIGRLYAVPVLDDSDTGRAPQPIPAWSRNIAAYNATLTWRRGKDLADQDPVVRRYNATMVALTAVRDGKAVLQIPDATGPSQGVGFAEVVNQYQGSMFVPQDFDGLGSSGDLNDVFSGRGGGRSGRW